jgi:hypothetical protein
VSMIDNENPFHEGDWVQWTHEHAVKRGQVVTSKGPSIIVRWLDGEKQVFPIVWQYVRQSIADRMVRIERPREALRIERDTRAGRMSIARAASTLGTTPKRVRAMLRAGQLKGKQIDGKWKSVDL